MRISESSSTKGEDGKHRVTTLTVEAEKGEDLKDFEIAINSHKWVRQNEHGEIETAPAHKDPPILFDKDIDPIWDGKPAILRQIHKAGKKSAFEDRSFYLQHIGAAGERWEKAPKLILAGFEPLRSKRSLKDGKCWEIWYLCGAWAAKGVLEGKKEKDIIEWIRQEIAPGQMALSGQSWALVYVD